MDNKFSKRSPSLLDQMNIPSDLPNFTLNKNSKFLKNKKNLFCSFAGNTTMDDFDKNYSKNLPDIFDYFQKENNFNSKIHNDIEEQKTTKMKEEKDRNSKENNFNFPNSKIIDKAEKKWNPYYVLLFYKNMKLAKIKRIILF